MYTVSDTRNSNKSDISSFITYTIIVVIIFIIITITCIIIIINNKTEEIIVSNKLDCK